ncbi:MAG: hypothetical protein FWG13_02260 [Leptospirales bacterium]|nr:hypothetical protein [Leptospirales bacterium]
MKIKIKKHKHKLLAASLVVVGLTLFLFDCGGSGGGGFYMGERNYNAGTKSLADIFDLLKSGLGKISFGTKAFTSGIDDYELQVAYIFGGADLADFETGEEDTMLRVFFPLDDAVFVDAPDGLNLYLAAERAIAAGRLTRSPLKGRVRTGYLEIPAGANIGFLTFQLEIYLEGTNNNYGSGVSKPGYLTATPQIYFVRGSGLTKPTFYHTLSPRPSGLDSDWRDPVADGITAKYPATIGEGRFVIFPFDGIAQGDDLELNWDLSVIQSMLLDNTAAMKAAEISGDGPQGPVLNAMKNILKNFEIKVIKQD